MSPAFVLAAAKKDLLRRARDPWAFLLWLGIPLLLGLLIGMMNRGGGKPRGRLLVADGDGTFLSHAVSSAFAQKPLSEMFDVESVDEARGRERMDQGDASALVVLPKGFGRAVLRDEPCRLELVLNPAQRILPAIAEETLGVMVEAVFYAQRVAGDRLRAAFEKIADDAGAAGDTWTEAFVADFGVEIRRSLERVSKYLSPPAIRVDAVQPPAEPASKPSFVSLFFPSMIFMAFFFMAQGLSDDVWREKAEGTLRRAISSPGSVLGLFAGKLLAGSVLLLLVALLALSIGAAFFGFPWSSLPAGCLWLVGSGLLLTALLTLVQLFASSQRAGHLLTNTVLFPMVMLGGSFFPFEVMPAWMASIGRKTPNGWALEGLKSILFARASAGEIGIGLLALFLGSLLLCAVCSYRLRGAFARA
jgi:ABC-type Na+ efflux pump permease subunit